MSDSLLWLLMSSAESWSEVRALTGLRHLHINFNDSNPIKATHTHTGADFINSDIIYITDHLSPPGRLQLEKKSVFIIISSSFYCSHLGWSFSFLLLPRFQPLPSPSLPPSPSHLEAPWKRLLLQDLTPNCTRLMLSQQREEAEERREGWKERRESRRRLRELRAICH